MQNPKTELKTNAIKKPYFFWKRAAGIFGSLLALLLFWWLLLILAIIQKCTSKGPVLFRQKRVGKGGKLFTLYKFRSMRVDVDPNMTSAEAGDTDCYVTKFGKFLRKTSLDEWPQLFNILKGDMAFIGPRPLIEKDEDAITVAIRRENGAINLRPGMSGLAQVSGRVKVSPEDKGNLDGEYYRTISLWTDIEIFFKTIGKVFGNKDTKSEEKPQQTKTKE